jgi:adenosylhomocysteine nucleosidase
VIALKDELLLGEDSLDVPLIITGMGLLSAYKSVYSNIVKHKPKYVLNLGTSASVSKSFSVGEIVHPTEFYTHPIMQVSEDIRSLGVSLSNVPTMLNSIPSNCLSHFRTCSISSGDVFITDKNVHMLGDNFVDVVDMEAYAIALACEDLNTPFYCIKYVTDSVLEKNTEFDWSLQLSVASKKLTEVSKLFLQHTH